MKKVVVVGGGFSGMVTAYYLSRAGFSVELHELTSRLGGLLGTEKTKSGLVESAANGFILNDDLAELFQELGLEYIQPKKETAKKRYIYRDGLKRWPLTLLETATLLCKFPLKMIFNRKALVPKIADTIWTWGLRHLGLGATKYLASPALQGIYAGDSQRMSASLILGPLFQNKKQKYRGTVSLQNGMGEFITALEKKLREQKVEIHLNSNYKVKSLDIPHIVCVSAAAAPSVVDAVSPQVGTLLSRIEVLPVMSVTLFYAQPQKMIEGFGGLFPTDQGFKVLGILSNTYIFEGRGPQYSETWIFGGTHSAEILGQSDEAVLKTIQSERSRILGVQDDSKDYRIHRWPKALPHYTLTHQEILQKIELPKNLYLVGNYVGVIGLSKILSKAKELVQNLSRELP